MIEGQNVKSGFSICGRLIGKGQRPYIIAEMSGNHNGDLSRAFEILNAAKAAGVDAVKIQTYTADTITIDCSKPDFLINAGPWAGQRLYDLYKQASTPWEWHTDLFDHAQSLGLTIFSSPFDDTAVEFLESLGAPAYKIASFELIDLPLVRRVARTGKPMILSTGMATLEETIEAVATVREAGCEDFVLLHCVSGYPTPIQDVNLKTLRDLGEACDALVGLSDHTLGDVVSIAATALGASVIEKHLTLNRSEGGPDAAFSLEPDEFTQLVQHCNEAYLALGAINYELKPSETQNVIFRRSLYAVRDIAEGEEFTAQNVRSIRPGFGLAPKFLDQVIGRRAATQIERGTAIKWNLMAD
jgi:N-acetylneuraminate synthase